MERRAASSGDSDTAELKWQHIAVRTASAKAGLYASLSTRKAHSYLDDVELLVQRRQTTFVETGVSFRQLYAGDASLDVELGYRRGMAWFSAQGWQMCERRRYSMAVGSVNAKRDPIRCAGLEPDAGSACSDGYQHAGERGAAREPGAEPSLQQGIRVR